MTILSSEITPYSPADSHRSYDVTRCFHPIWTQLFPPQCWQITATLHGVISKTVLFREYDEPGSLAGFFPTDGTHFTTILSPDATSRTQLITQERNNEPTNPKPNQTKPNQPTNQPTNQIRTHTALPSSATCCHFVRTLTSQKSPDLALTNRSLWCMFHV
jgi:hypothetical protein